MGIGVENDSTFAGFINLSHENSEVYNSALIGYSSADYTNIVQKLIVSDENKLNISDIFIFWCLNDVYSNFPDENSPEYKLDFIKHISKYLSQNFKLYHFAKHTFSDRSKSYFLYDNSFYDIANKHFNTSISHLIKINSIASSYNIKLHLFMLPYEYQLRNHYYKNIFKPQDLLLQTLSNTIRDIKDMSIAFNLSKAEFKKYYLYGDGIHFSQKGHKLIADYVVKQLKNEFSD